MDRKQEVEQVFSWHGTDKFGHGYAMIYSKVPRHIRAVFEIGVAQGESIRSWLDLFPEAEIYAIDSEHKPVEHPRVHNIHCPIQDFKIDSIPSDVRFGLIVDDGSHQVDHVVKGWEILRHRCCGIYVVEDMGVDEASEVCKTFRRDSQVVSSIQTANNNGDRCVIASFGQVIQW